MSRRSQSIYGVTQITLYVFILSYISVVLRKPSLSLRVIQIFKTYLATTTTHYSFKI